MAAYSTFEMVNQKKKMATCGTYNMVTQNIP